LGVERGLIIFELGAVGGVVAATAMTLGRFFPLFTRLLGHGDPRA